MINVAGLASSITAFSIIWSLIPLFTSFKGRRHGLIRILIKILGRSGCKVGDLCDSPLQRARFGVVSTLLG